MPSRTASEVHATHGHARVWWIVLSLAALPVAPARAAAEDPRDLLVIMPALNDALENERSGKDISWTNVATGRAGSIRIERTFYRGLQPCREYARTTSGNGPGYEVRGTGCRVGKLNWSVDERRIDDPSPTATAPAATPVHPPPAAPAPAPAATPAAADPSTATARDPARSGDPSTEPASSRPPRKASTPPPPPPPSLTYGLPTRSQL